MRSWALGICLLILGGCMGSGDSANSQPAYAPASPPTASVPPQSDRTYVPGERIGMIEAGMSAAQIENLYGSDDFVATDIDAGEGTTEQGYLLFPGTVDEVVIQLGPDKQPATAALRNERATWYTTEFPGLAPGASLRELIDANGRNFVFRGFGWDYGGTVSDWRGGELEGIHVRLNYATERIGADGLDTTLTGDVPVRSNVATVESLDLRVQEIAIDISGKE